MLAFSHRIAALRHGVKVGEMATSDADERAIARMMVGADTLGALRDAKAPGAPVPAQSGVSVKGTSAWDSLTGGSLTVHAHEVLGIAGVSGNGQAAWPE